MKIKTYMLIFCSLLILTEVSAQSNKSKPIQSGFVFIDGEYIELPYTIKRQGLTVTINGTQILKMQKPESLYSFKKRPQMPIETLNKNSSLDEINKIMHPDYARSYIQIFQYYFFEKYNYNTACDSIRNLYRSLPNIKSIENYKDRNDIFEITAFNGDARKYSLSPYGKIYSHEYGPESKKFYNRDELILNAEGEVQSIQNKLEQNKMVFFFTDKDLINRIKSYSVSEENSHLVYDVLQSDYNSNQKVDSLNNIFFDKAFLKRIIKEYQKTEKVRNRFDNANNNSEKNADDTGLIMPYQKEKSTKGQFHTPQKTEIMAWCPDPLKVTKL